MENHTAIHSQKRFPCAVMTQNAKKRGHDQGAERGMRKHVSYAKYSLKIKKIELKETKTIIQKVIRNYDPGCDADLTSSSHEKYNVLESSSCVPNLFSSCNDACNKFFITIYGNLLRWCLDGPKRSMGNKIGIAIERTDA